jgi:hypothetical protein
VFVSIPIAMLVVGRLVESLAALRRAGWWGSRMAIHRAPIATGLLLLLLDASGVVRGEIGRSWTPIMPFLLLVATVSVRHPASAGDGGGGSRTAVGGPTTAESLTLGFLLLAHCWVLRLCWGL